MIAEARTLWVIGGLVGLAAVFTGCQSAQDAINDQNRGDLAVKASELSTIGGADMNGASWTGKMHLTSLNQDFDCWVTIAVKKETEKSEQPEAPSETVEVATLAGNLTFPALVKLPLEDYPGFQPLLDPMDGYGIADIVEGDFQSSDQSFVLPYRVGQESTDFGDLEGNLVNGQLVGKWFANDFGYVGTFVLNRSPLTPPANSATLHGGSAQ